MSFLGKLFGRSSAGPTLSLHETGLVLAGSLIAGHDPNGLNAHEAEFIREAALSRGAYVQERFIFMASAAASAISLIGEPSHRDVSRGFFQWFADQSKASTDNALLAALFQKRLPSYLAASVQEGLIHEPSALLADHLAERASEHETAQPYCLTFALTVGPAYWHSQVKGAAKLFGRVNLLASET